MIDILELMRENVKKINDSEQVKFFREVIEPSFKGLLEHTDNMYKGLEENIYRELTLSDYDIYTGLLPRNELKYHDLYLNPILERENINKNYDEILKELISNEEAIVEQIFLPLEEKDINMAIYGKSYYIAYLRYKERKCKVKIALERVEEYEKREEDIYKVFLKNNIKWKTINNPYIRKILQVKIIAVLGDIEEIEEIESIEYTDFEFEYKRDLVPVWNIVSKNRPVKDSIAPAEDSINYVYPLLVDELKNSDNKAIVYFEKGNIKAVNKNSQGNLEIVLDTQNVEEIDIHIFKNINEYQKENIKYPVMSNEDVSILDKIKSSNRIKTELEIRRIVETYGKDFGIKVEDIQINSDDSGIESNLNPFIKDEIHLGNIDKYLIIYLQCENENYLSEYAVNYILSKLQLEINNFHCRGALL